MHEFLSISNEKKKQRSSNIFFDQHTHSPFFDPSIQPKLTINQPNDPDNYRDEQEADAMAEKVMRMNGESNASKLFFNPPVNPLQRKCAHCEEEENLQKKPIGSETTNETITGSFIGSLSGGRGLSKGDRSFFESRMGYDFSDVKIHTNTAAAKSAQDVNALAYTIGNNIVFNTRQFNPETESGKRLMAHELTHVIQQSHDDVSLKRAPEMIQRQMDKDPSELDDELLQNEYDALNEYVHRIEPEDYAAEEENMNYFLALEKELKKRCMKSKPSHPTTVSDKLIDRITGKYEKIDGDPGEGRGFYKPYLAPEGQCTVGYGHVIFPKSDCTIDMGKNTCICAAKWNLSGEPAARKLLRNDMKVHVNEVNKKIKVDLNEAEFDAMVDLSAHVGSMPSEFANYVNENWCTNKEAVREKYLRTAITMKDPKTKKSIVMKNFVERRKRRAW